MKKIRIMLSAILVIAVVSGALAFKSYKTAFRLCFYKGGTTFGQACTALTSTPDALAVIDPAPDANYETAYYTASGATCDAQSTKTCDQQNLTIIEIDE
jgi:hypothetical protein